MLQEDGTPSTRAALSLTCTLVGSSSAEGRFTISKKARGERDWRLGATAVT
jgi:hypothetical protein